MPNDTFNFADDGRLDAVDHDWGTLVRFAMPRDVKPWQVWLQIEWPEVQPGKVVLLAGDGPDWFERELEDQYTPVAAWVSHVNPRVAGAPPEVLPAIVNQLRQERIEAALKRGGIIGRRLKGSSEK